MLNNAGSSTGLVVVLEGGCSGLSLLQLLRHQLLSFQRWGWGATMGDRWGCLLVNAPLYFLLLLQRFDKSTFQPIGMLRFQSLLLIGWHALFAKHCSAFCFVLPPAAGKVSVALGTDEGISDSGLGESYTCLSWVERKMTKKNGHVCMVSKRSWERTQQTYANINESRGVLTAFMGLLH